MTLQQQNELYQSIVHHSTKFSFMYKLDKDEYQNVLSDTYMKVYDKIESGHVPIDKYLGYMTLVLKNKIYRVFEVRNTFKGRGQRDFILDYTVFEQPSIDINRFDYLLIKDRINQLPPIDRALLRFRYKRGWFIREIAEMIDIDRGVCTRRIEKILKQVLA